jgi:ABC-type nitrate/sulfonate/bicarbonate transport system ATPase subunit
MLKLSPMISSPSNINKLLIRDLQVNLDQLAVLQDINIEVKINEYVTLVGPSGCGKSTLFNVISGLIKPNLGSVWIDQTDCTGKTGLVGYMQQKDLLLPWFTIYDNISLPLKIRGIKRNEIQKKIREELSLFGLEGFEKKFPIELSGGMRQKAALLRTIFFEKDILLLDEPFGKLDAITRKKMQDWMMKIKYHFHKTIIMITHDIDEAIFLSDRIFVMSSLPGRIIDSFEVELPKPRDLSIQTSVLFNKYKKRVMELL